MSFGQEMKDFIHGSEAASRILYTNEQRKKSHHGWYMDPKDRDATPSTFEGAGGSGVGTADAPKQGGDPNQKGGGGFHAPKTADMPNAAGGSFLKQAYDYYRARGLSHAHAAGIAANLQWESGGSADVLSGHRMGDNGTAGYAGQWRGSRLQNLMSFAKQNGHPKPTLQDQLDFVLEEGDPNSPFMEPGAVEAMGAAAGAKTPQEAVEVFMNKFERPNPQYAALDKRIALLSQISDTGAAGSAADGNTGAGGAQDAAPSASDLARGRGRGAIDDSGDTGGGAQDAAPEEQAVEAPTIDMPAAPAPPQVQAPALENFDNPFLAPPGAGLYAQGGAIPDDEQRFAVGGSPVGTRDYTYQGAASSTPATRRINVSGGGSSGTNGGGQDWRSWASSGSPAQQKFRQYRTDQETAKTNAAAAAAQPAATTQAATTERMYTVNGRQMTESEYNRIYGRYMSMPGYNYSNQYNSAGGGGRAGSAGYSSSSGRASGSGGFYKEGGRVARRRRPEDEAEARLPDFGELNRRARSQGQPSFQELQNRSSQGASGRRTDQDSRDAAARRLNMATRGVNSTAWRETPEEFPNAPKALSLKPNHAVVKQHVQQDPPPTPPQELARASTGLTMPSPQAPQPGSKGHSEPPPNSSVIDLNPSKAPPATTQNDQRPGPLVSVPEVTGYDENGNPTFNFPTSSQVAARPGWQRVQEKGYARGGAIPDDDYEFGSSRAADANYQRQRRRPKAAAAAPTQTKASQKVRRKNTDKPATRSARKKAGKKPQYERTPSRGPIPTPRPNDDVNVPTPSPRPNPDQVARPQQGPPQPTADQASWDRAREAWRRQQENLPPEDDPWADKPQQGPPQPAPVDNAAWDRARQDLQRQRATLPPGEQQGPPMPVRTRSPQMRQNAPLLDENDPRWARDDEMRQNAPLLDEDDPRWARDQETPWLGYARGGAIPDEEGPPFPKARAEEAAYSTSSANPAAAASAPQQQMAGPWGAGEDVPDRPAMSQAATGQRVQDTPPEPNIDQEAVRRESGPNVRFALDGLKRLLGLGSGGGAIATEEDGARRAQGVQRMARGEGAATRQEIEGIDRTFGLDQVQADAGMKNLIRIDKTVQYWLQNGNKDNAEAAAASLLMYGATEVKRSGMMAAAAFEHYQKTGDPRDLRNASLAVQRAQQMIPDGMNVKIDVDPKTHQIVATTIDDKGQQQKQVVDPSMVPQLLGKAMDGSAYWNAVFQVGQPEMARSQATGSNKAADRQFQVDFDQYKHDRDLKDQIDKEARDAERKLWEHDRDTDEGRSETERKKNEEQAYLTDWNKRLAAAKDPAEKQKVFAEGLDWRWNNTRDRQTPVPEETLLLAQESAYKDKIKPEDLQAVRNLARVIAVKNDALDGPGAMEMASALILTPKEQVINRPDGTLDVAGYSLVFNPMLLPQLGSLRSKYRQPQ